MKKQVVRKVKAPVEQSTPLTVKNLFERLPQQSPAWIVEAHRYYAEHGHYRGSDLTRLLGRPRVYTEGQAITEFVGNGIFPKK